MLMQETDLGFEFQTPTSFFFFGKKAASVERIQQTYPQYRFFKTKQLHGNHIHQLISANDSLEIEADGQFTNLKGAALLIATADCLPVLMAHPHSMTVMGIHAGWRGIATRIITKGLQGLLDQGAKPDEIFVFIGPHIQQSSFEVSEDVKNQLLASVITEDAHHLKHLAHQNQKEGAALKFYVDLNALAKLQISQFAVPVTQVFDLHLDTFTDLKFHSFRRDPAAAGRQYSFVVRK